MALVSRTSHSHPSAVFALLWELPFAVSSGVLINAQHVPFAMKRSSKPTDDAVSWRRASNTSCIKCKSIAFSLINISYYYCLSAHRFNFIYDTFLLYGFFMRVWGQTVRWKTCRINQNEWIITLKHVSSSAFISITALVQSSVFFPSPDSNHTRSSPSSFLADNLSSLLSNLLVK